MNDHDRLTEFALASWDRMKKRKLEERMSREVCVHGVEITQDGTGRKCPACALKGWSNAIDTLYPHGDEAGRVTGAMSDPFAGIPTDYGFEPQRSERNRLVWEAMLVALPANISWLDDQGEHIPNEVVVRVTLNDAIAAADTYLAWRDEQ